jgi:glycosyltransferase involved in cell wall biosynthesis
MTSYQTLAKVKPSNYEMPSSKLSADWPAVSFVIATLNNESTIEACLRSISLQSYPSESVESVVADGGSTDGTVATCVRWGARVVSNPKVTEKGFDGGKNAAINAARNPIIIIVDADNILGSPDYTKNLIEPFLADAEIILSSPVVTADRQWTPFQRYSSYVYDPFDYSFNPSCEERTHRSISNGRWVLMTRRDGEKVYVGNGTAVRRSALLAVGGYEFDLETGVRISELGKMALCPSALLLHQNARNVRELIRKRIRAAMALVEGTGGSYEQRGAFKTLVLQPSKRGTIRVALQCMANLTIIRPLYVSVVESNRRSDSAMLLHFVFAPITTLVYIVVLLRVSSGRAFLRHVLWRAR